MKRTQLWICLFATLLMGVAVINQSPLISFGMLTFQYGVVALFIEEIEAPQPVKKTLGALAIITYIILSLL